MTAELQKALIHTKLNLLSAGLSGYPYMPQNLQ